MFQETSASILHRYNAFKFHHISSFKQTFIDVNITGVKTEFIVRQLFAVYFAFAHKNMKSQRRNPLFFSLNFSKP